ncbi:hypothetical protein Tco_0709860 [Tanacetum coccineum]
MVIQFASRPCDASSSLVLTSGVPCSRFPYGRPFSISNMSSSYAPISSKTLSSSVAAGAGEAIGEGITGETGRDSENHSGDASVLTDDGGVWTGVVEALTVGDDAGDDDEERVIGWAMYARPFVQYCGSRMIVEVGPQMAQTQCLEQWVSRKRISEKRMKNQAKNDKTNYGIEKRES